MAIFNVQRAITPKVCNPELQFAHYACRLMVLNLCVKFHVNVLNGFEVTERTQVCGKNCHFSFFYVQTAITPKECHPVMIPALCMSSHPPYICVTFHDNISK